VSLVESFDLNVVVQLSRLSKNKLWAFDAIEIDKFDI